MTFVCVAVSSRWFIMHNCWETGVDVIFTRPGKAVHIVIEGDEVQGIFTQWLWP